MSESLQQQNRALRAQLKKAQEQIEKQAVLIKQLQNLIFGEKTEVIEELADGQLSLFDEEQFVEPEHDVTEVAKTTVTKVVHHRKSKIKPTRAEFLNQLPQTEEIVPLNDRKCPTCQQPMKYIGKRLARREVRMKEPELYCVNYYQESCKCEHCSKDGVDKIISSRVPMALLPHSYFSSSIMAQIANYKFNLALPFHRQVELWQTVGLPINDKQMAVNTIKVSQTYLVPLYERLCQLTKEESVIHMDETPFRVINSGKSKSYFWVTRTTKEFAHHQMVVFHHANTRSGNMVGQIVGQAYAGLIMCDGYGGYSNNLYPKARFGTCLVHIRREFANIIKSSPRNLRSSKALQAVKLLSRVFHTENQLNYQTAEEKLAERQLKLRPLLDNFYQYLETIRHPIGKLRDAIENAMKLRSRVYRIFENGQLPLSNNPVEQSIRPSTLIRKNCLFAKTDAGAKANAIFYSVVQTAKLNQLNVYQYLKYLFDHLPSSKKEDLEGYLPWAKTVQAECHQ